jgi:signal transduction histidine kinase
MRRAPIRDPRARRLVLAFLAAACLSWWWASVSDAVIRRDTALVGKLLAAQPEAGQEIVSAFTRQVTDAEETAGRREAARYGYEVGLPPAANPVLAGRLALGAGLAAALIAASVLAFTLIALGALRRVLYGVREVSDAVATIVAGNPSLRLPQGGEGELSALGHRVNQMAGRLLAALEQVQREKDYLKDFLTDVSHQLKTPLSSVRMFTELLLDGGSLDPGNRSDFLGKSLGQIDRMEWLIASLLACARMEAGAVELRMQSAPLQHTVQASLEGLRAQWTRAGVTVELRAPDDPVAVRHDPRWLGEALSNIVKNSIEHTPRGGSVQVAVEKTALLARVTVSDTGEGIDREDLPRIFDRFFRPRGSQGDASSLAGTGVGLALARVIVERHDGAVSVTSAPGSGTHFTVTLHAVDA